MTTPTPLNDREYMKQVRGALAQLSYFDRALVLLYIEFKRIQSKIKITFQK